MELGIRPVDFSKNKVKGQGIGPPDILSDDRL